MSVTDAMGLTLIAGFAVACGTFRLGRMPTALRWLRLLGMLSCFAWLAHLMAGPWPI